MPYEMHRIFCATPGDLEPERQAFHHVMGEFNQSQAMSRGILFVTVSVLPNMVHLPTFEAVLDENVRACSYYIQVLGESWGPPTRNFERYFELAKECSLDPGLPMREAVALVKSLPVTLHADGARNIEYADIGSYKQQLRALLSEWLETVKA